MRAAGNLGQYDCVLIVTDHSDYDYARIVRESQLVVDTRNATRGIKSPKDRPLLKFQCRHRTVWTKISSYGHCGKNSLNSKPERCRLRLIP